MTGPTSPDDIAERICKLFVSVVIDDDIRGVDAVVRKAQADAWDRGAEAAFRASSVSLDKVDPVFRSNPYRKESR